MYYSYFKRNGIEYASAAESVRDGKRVTKGGQVYLGRVVDRELHLFRSRERGLFRYDIETGEYLEPPRGYEEPPAPRKSARPRRKARSVSFGDVWLLDRFLRSCGLMTCVEATCAMAGPAPDLDTVCALLEYYVLCSLSRCPAEDWWELTYAHTLFPEARLSSQHVGEVLSYLGSEEAIGAFFGEYLRLAGRVDDAVLVVDEDRALACVVRQHAGLPLFFQAFDGDVVDGPAIARMVRDLERHGVSTRYAILDAGHGSHAIAEALNEAGVPFLMRMDPDDPVHERAVEEHFADLECGENAVYRHDRLAYVEPIDCKVGSEGECPAYFYICKGETMRGAPRRDVAESGECDACPHDGLADGGVSVLASTEGVARKELLSLYHVRDRVDEFCEIAARGERALPADAKTEVSLRGHLLLSFTAAVVLEMMSDRLATANASLTTEAALWVLHEHHATVFDDEVMVQEPTRRMREAYEAFGLTCPEVVRRGDVG